MSGKRLLGLIAVLVGSGCAGGSVATTPVATPANTPASVSQSGIAVPVGGGIVQLPAAGGRAQSMTFLPGNPTGLSIDVRTLSFGQTAQSVARRSAKDISSQYIVCPLTTVVFFTVSKEEALSQLGDFGFSPLPFEEQVFQNGNLTVALANAGPQDLGGTVDKFLSTYAIATKNTSPPAGYCENALYAQLFYPLPFGQRPKNEYFATGTGTFLNGTSVAFPLTPTSSASPRTLVPGNLYVLFATFGSTGAGASLSPSPSPSPSPAPSATTSPSPTPSPSPSPTSSPTAAPSAAGTLTINPGSGNVFPGTPPASLGSLSPSLFYTGTIAGIVAPMSAPYFEVAGASPHGCPVSGTVIYSLEITYPTIFAFATAGTTGYMQTIITPGTADGTSYHAALFRAGACATLGGPSVVTVGGGTLTFDGGGALTIGANETDVVQFWH